MARAVLLLAVLGVAESMSPPVARAQDADEEARALELARELYETGVRAAAAERWTDAAEAFERSYETAPTTPALANLLRAQLALDRFVEARRSARRLLARGDLPEDTRAWAERMERTAEAGVARIRVTGLEREVPTRISLNGNDVDPATFGADGVHLDVDPGRHTIVVEQMEREPRVFRVEVHRGEERTLHVLPAPELATPDARIEDREPEPGSLWSEPAFWIVAGGVVAAIGAAIVLAIVLAEPEDQRLEPRTDVVFPL